MKKVLILGASSYIAVELIKIMLSESYEVYAVIRPRSENRNRLSEMTDKIKIIELEQKDYSELGNICLTEEAFDLCYYFTWAGVRERNNEVIQNSNYIAYKEALDSLKTKVKKMVGVGSWAEYGSVDKVMTEDSKVNPLNPYGKYKHMCCQYGLKIASECEMNFVWARIFSVYGPGDYGQSLVMQACRKMIRNETVDLSECEHMWNFLYVTDAAKILYALGDESKAKGIYNVASSDSRMLKEYLHEIKRISGSQSILNFGAVQSVNIDMRPSIAKLVDTLGNIEETGFELGIQEILNATLSK